MTEPTTDADNNYWNDNYDGDDGNLNEKWNIQILSLLSENHQFYGLVFGEKRAKKLGQCPKDKFSSSLQWCLPLYMLLWS